RRGCGRWSGSLAGVKRHMRRAAEEQAGQEVLHQPPEHVALRDVVELLVQDGEDLLHQLGAALGPCCREQSLGDAFDCEPRSELIESGLETTDEKGGTRCIDALLEVLVVARADLGESAHQDAADWTAEERTRNGEAVLRNLLP